MSTFQTVKAVTGRLARSFVDDPAGTVHAVVHIVRTDAAMHLIRVTGAIAPTGTVTEAEGGASDADGKLLGRPEARLLVVAHEPMAGAILTLGIARTMQQNVADALDLARLAAEPAADDPFATKEG
jgi:hypothetical protein